MAAIRAESVHKLRSIAIGHPDVAVASVTDFIHRNPGWNIFLRFVSRMRGAAQGLDNPAAQRAFFDFPGEFISQPKKFLSVILDKCHAMGAGILSPAIEQLPAAAKPQNGWNRLTKDENIAARGAGHAVSSPLARRPKWLRDRGPLLQPKIGAGGCFKKWPGTHDFTSREKPSAAVT
jgi:hypothetical protein